MQEKNIQTTAENKFFAKEKLTVKTGTGTFNVHVDESGNLKTCNKRKNPARIII
jgi:hypothetical protein